ncbi:MAG: hypothetical protein HFH87_06130 [Lachnospiraceae bacterium]|nr:hypothetical protein [Lachnospiraceae bacterium]
MKEKEDLYLRKQSKFYNRGNIEPIDVVSDIDKSNFVKRGYYFDYKGKTTKI